MTRLSDRLYDLPPSAKLVLKVLAIDGTMTQGQLATETRLSKRTVRDALERLRDVDVIDERVDFRDARRSLYSVSDSIASDQSVGFED
ncbi:helix-turn-helix domain-containing protein [Natrinema sp. 1APR25-10V2]|uniref:MarR family transcriptional regulator n=1 Tax=Natrinema sp. 1APR25-10V2 TaxID=2951081 RepID=UPI0028749441|nr:helix-turn-helix domain-containing protein [Natrinema sp. 1APR25-10V2]MDS0475528.1 MarR family transcriptional regulator [Natrinema sp. 1APR25-10V2]